MCAVILHLTLYVIKSNSLRDRTRDIASSVGRYSAFFGNKKGAGMPYRRVGLYVRLRPISSTGTSLKMLRVLYTIGCPVSLSVPLSLSVYVRLTQFLCQKYQQTRRSTVNSSPVHVSL